jgi:hypothetical protein
MLGIRRPAPLTTATNTAPAARRRVACKPHTNHALGHEHVHEPRYVRPHEPALAYEPALAEPYDLMQAICICDVSRIMCTSRMLGMSLGRNARGHAGGPRRISPVEQAWPGDLSLFPTRTATRVRGTAEISLNPLRLGALPLNEADAMFTENGKVVTYASRFGAAVHGACKSRTDFSLFWGYLYCLPIRAAMRLLDMSGAVSPRTSSGSLLTDPTLAGTFHTT